MSPCEAMTQHVFSLQSYNEVIKKKKPTISICFLHYYMLCNSLTFLLLFLHKNLGYNLVEKDCLYLCVYI